MKTTMDGVFVEVDGELCDKEIREYLFYLRNKFKLHTLESVHISVEGDYVGLRYKIAPKKFERIRRVTGYLSGTLDTWNNAKKSEERDRVKHI